MAQRVSVRYSGRVQGVGFRATVRQLAEGRPITGWVRNEPDGTVAMEAQGDDASVEDFLAGVERAMRGSISASQREAAEHREGERSFEIIR
ncbi:MAG: acylphosphatase [Planctomycetota bacterium]